MRRLALATLAVAVALVLAPAALGDTDTVERSDVPAASLTQLSGQTIKCWATDYWVQFVRKSSVGIKLWHYRLTIDDFCWNGTKIVLVNSHRSVGGPYWPCWIFDGHIGNEVQKNASWSWKRIIEGKFTWLCPPLIYSKTPEVWVKLRGDGYHASGVAS
jgi:hypothetical protein